MEKIINYITENWEFILPIIIAIYELVIRVKPTNKSKSIVNWVAVVFDKVVPNLKKGGGKFNLKNLFND